MGGAAFFRLGFDSPSKFLPGPQVAIQVPSWRRIMPTLMLCSGISSVPLPPCGASPGSPSGSCLPLNGPARTRTFVAVSQAVAW